MVKKEFMLITNSMHIAEPIRKAIVQYFGEENIQVYPVYTLRNIENSIKSNKSKISGIIFTGGAKERDEYGQSIKISISMSYLKDLTKGKDIPIINAKGLFGKINVDKLIFKLKKIL